MSDERVRGVERRELPGAHRGDRPMRRGDDRTKSDVREAIRNELANDDPIADARENSAEARRIESNDPCPVIELDRVYLAFDNPVLEDISFTAFEGETFAIVGESGTGKSTILKLMLRLLVPDRGRVCIDGEDITDLKFEDALAVRRKMGMVFQGAALFDSLSVYENVAYPLRERANLSEDEIEERVREKLEFVDLDPDRVMEQMPAELSGGMKKRVGIARGMADNPEIVLYDEPTSGLDPLTTNTITHLIRKLQKELGVTSIVVSHDMSSVFRMANKVALLHECRMPFIGTPEEMMASEEPYIREFIGAL